MQRAGDLARGLSELLDVVLVEPRRVPDAVRSQVGPETLQNQQLVPTVPQALGPLLRGAAGEQIGIPVGFARHPGEPSTGLRR